MTFPDFEARRAAALRCGVPAVTRLTNEQAAVRTLKRVSLEATTDRRTAYDEWAAHYAYMSSSDPHARCSCAACNAGAVAS